MTIELCTGPGTPTFTSTRYFAEVNGSPNYVVQWNTQLAMNVSSEGNFFDPMKKCMTRWGTDGETVQLVVTLIDGSGPVTSYELLPHFDDVAASINGAGKLVLTVPAGRMFRVWLNGNMLAPLFVSSGPLESAVPPGAVTWAAWLAAHPGQPFIDDDTDIYFPPGEHTVPQFAGVGIIAGDRCTIHLDRDAIVDGRFYLGLADDSVFKGPGHLHNVTQDPEAVWALIVGGATFDEQSLFALFTNAGGPFLCSNVLKEMTLFGSGFGCVVGGINDMQDCVCICYSRGGIGIGPDVRPRLVDGRSYVLRCFIDAGDDAVFATAVQGNTTIRGCTIGTSLNSTVHGGYWAYGDGPTNLFVTPGPLVEDCAFYHLGIADNNTDVGYPSIGDQTVFACRVDATESGAAAGMGHYNVTMRNCRVYGRIRSRGIFLRNEPYPYDIAGVDDTYDQAGNISGFVFEGVTFDHAPEQGNMVVGRDIANCTHTLHLRGVSMGGVLLEQHNVRAFFTFNAQHYRIYVQGFPVAISEDIANQALSHIGVHRRITSLSPPDGSVEAETLLLAFDTCVDSLLAQHPWDFATTRVALTAATNDREDWQQCYLLPDGLLRVLHLLPPDATKDYPDQFAQPQSDYAIELNSDGARRLYCNIEDAHLRYVVRIYDPTMWSPLFRMTVEWLLASQVAGSLIGGESGQEKARSALQMAEGFMARAARTDSKMRRRTPDYTPNWIAARN